ncbi:unnamed protein product, partial [marine sediment metagenome]
MYRIFLKSFLDTQALKAANKHSSKDLKYCNGLCQDLVAKTQFSSTKMICRSCMNTINLAKKQIDDQKITLEQFKKDPAIVYKNKNNNNNNNENEITIKKKCKTCKQEKNIIDFEKGRKECKSCRYIKASEQNNNIDEYVEQIKKLKNDLTKLKTLLSHIPKDKLIIIIA